MSGPKKKKLETKALGLTEAQQDALDDLSPVDTVIAETIFRLALTGAHTQAEIAALVGIAERTLRRKYKEFWEQGAIHANSKVVGRLYRDAISDDPKTIVAAIFWMKTRGGWKENQVIEANITVPTLQLVAASSVPDMPPALVKTLKDLAD